MLVTVGTHTLALGVQWSYASNKNEARGLIKSAKKCYLTVVSSTSGTAENWIGVYNAGNPKAALAGSALIGLVASNAILCERVSDTLSWITVIQDGKPAVGYEELIVTANAREHAMGLMGMFNHAQLYGDLPGAKCDIAALVGQIESSVADKSISRKTLNALKFKRVGVSGVSLVVLLLATSLPVAAYFGWKHYQKLDLARQTAALRGAKAAKDALTADQLALEKQRLVNEFNSKVAKRRAELATQSKAGVVMPFWVDVTRVRQSLDVSQAGGYRPQRMRCDDHECRVDWDARGLFTTMADRSRLTGSLDVNDLSRGAQTLHPMMLSTLAASLVANDSSSMPPQAAALRFALVDQFSRVPGFVVEPPAPIVLTPPPNLDLVPVTVGQLGSIKLTMQGPSTLVRMQSVMQQLNAFPVAIKSVEIGGLFQSPSVTVEAGYVVVEKPN